MLITTRFLHLTLNKKVMATKEFLTSNRLMEAVRALGYKQQYKVCEAFYNEIIKYPRWDNNRFGLLFDDLFESIDPKNLEEQLLRLHQCVNELDNTISEIDDYDPTTFFQIAKELEKVMKR